MLNADPMIQMVDLKGQYLKIKNEVDAALQAVIDGTSFIGGKAVADFMQHLSSYMEGCPSVSCGNGTDALQIALMALGLKPGDEVIVPAFTYVASAEVIGLLGLTPVMVDVDSRTFNVTVENIKKGISPRTKAVIPVHLFGQSCDMGPILQLAEERHLFVIEDNAQAIGAEYIFADGRRMKTGTMGTVGCTSFFPSKNLGCYGDGGAIFTRDANLAERLRMIANHGQRVKYHHDVIGCNSRLDAMQAAVLDVKLPHLDEYCCARRAAAHYYTERFKAFDPEERYLLTPVELPQSTHVYHQYTLQVPDGRRDALKEHLAAQGIPSMIYYPLPLQEQEAFMSIARAAEPLTVAKQLAQSVLSLPMHTELDRATQDKVVDAVIQFFK